MNGTHGRTRAPKRRYVDSLVAPVRLHFLRSDDDHEDELRHRTAPLNFRPSPGGSTSPLDAHRQLVRPEVEDPFSARPFQDPWLAEFPLAEDLPREAQDPRSPCARTSCGTPSKAGSCAPYHGYASISARRSGRRTVGWSQAGISGTSTEDRQEYSRTAFRAGCRCGVR